MPVERSPLPLDSLPASLAPLFAPDAPPARVMMLARGMVPGLDPADLLVGLYQANLHSNEKIATSARKTAMDLPDNVLEGALTAPLPAPVLDLFAELCQDRPKHIERILLNQTAGDETMARLARDLHQEPLLEIIAKNEERLLRHPPIIKALYLNKTTRMSTANRCVELAVRNGVELDIPAYKEIGRALGAEPKYEDAGDQALADAATDATFADAVAEGGLDEEMPTDEELASEDEQDLRKRVSLVGLSVAQKIRLCMIGTSYHRALLLRDPNRIVALAAIKSPLIKDVEVVRVTQSRSVNDDVIRHIAQNRDWLKLYQVKVGLLNNPKTPLPTSMRLLPHLRLNDLRALTRSRNIPNALRQSANQLLKRKG